MSSLLAALQALPVEKPSGGRRVSLLTDDDEPQQNDGHTPTTPFLAGTATGDVIVSRRKREPKMPKGIYERKPKDAANDAAPEVKKRGRKPRTLAVVPKVAKPNGAAPGGRFDVSVDLRVGAVTINAQSGSLTLAPDEVLALFAFMARR